MCKSVMILWREYSVLCITFGVTKEIACSEFKNFFANNTKFINAAKSTDKYSLK